MNRVILALLVLCGMPWPACADDTKPLTAILLTARADLPDPHFQDAVVLVMNHFGSAPAGLILNKPTPVPVSHLFPDLERLARLDDKVYFGGPVAIEAVSFLFRAAKPPEHAMEVLDGVYISMNRELLRALLAREHPMEGLRVFIGYSGWARGQLEGEIARGDWTLAPADASAIFDGKSGHPWPERRRPGAVKRVRHDRAEEATPFSPTSFPRGDGAEALREKIDQRAHARRERAVRQVHEVDGALRHDVELAQQRYELPLLQGFPRHVDRQDADSQAGGDGRVHGVHVVGFERT